jgi:hypothetical protein
LKEEKIDYIFVTNKERKRIGFNLKENKFLENFSTRERYKFLK